MNINAQTDPLTLACEMCDTVIRTYPVEKLPGPPGRFNYIQGVFLLGMERCNALAEKPQYLAYIKDWADYMIDADGRIREQQELLDDLMPAVLLIDLYRRTGEQKYKTALDSTVARIKHWKRNRYGGFFHKAITPDQMWLDGLFMGGLLLTAYGEAFDHPEYFDEMHRQAMLMYEHIRDPKTGLYYHAWDAECVQEWADPKTGLSPEFWGRAMGWVAVALCEMLDHFPAEHPGRPALIRMLAELLDAVAAYQDPESGLWYQVIDKGSDPDNWCETSCSSLFAYAFHKAVRLGYIAPKYAQHAQRAYEGILCILRRSEAGIVIPKISVGTNVMDYAGYIARPRAENDNHGTGTFVLMCSEFAR